MDHGTIRNSVNDIINTHLCSFYRFVIGLEEKNTQSTLSSSPADAFSLQQLYDLSPPTPPKFLSVRGAPPASYLPLQHPRV